MNKTILLFAGIVIIGILVIYSVTSINLGKQNNQSLQMNTTQNTQPTAEPTKTVLGVSESDRTSAEKATIKTIKGDIVLKLYPKDSPKTVMNFATLVKKGYFNGLTFHRVVPGFVIQGGDPNGDGTGGTSIYGETFEDELNPNTPSYKEGYKEGVVAMANRGPNTNGSQFFIMLADNPLPHNYTIFGKVTQGIEVVKKIQVGDKMVSVVIDNSPSASPSPTISKTPTPTE